jgi:hypothetical protein
MNVDIEKVVAKGVAQVRQGAPGYDPAKAEAVVRQWVGEIIERYPEASERTITDAVTGRLADWIRGRRDLRETPPKSPKSEAGVSGLLEINRALTIHDEGPLPSGPYLPPPIRW